MKPVTCNLQPETPKLTTIYKHIAMNRIILFAFISFCVAATCFYSCKTPEKDNKPRRLELLFLGHKSKHHDSEKLAEILSQEYFKKGINITYSTNPDDMLREDFSLYDGLILYANYDSISPAQEKALLNFVRSGKGFIPLHCASWCFRNSRSGRPDWRTV